MEGKPTREPEEQPERESEREPEREPEREWNQEGNRGEPPIPNEWPSHEIRIVKQRHLFHGPPTNS